MQPVLARQRAHTCPLRPFLQAYDTCFLQPSGFLGIPLAGDFLYRGLTAQCRLVATLIRNAEGPTKLYSSRSCLRLNRSLAPDVSKQGAATLTNRTCLLLVAGRHGLVACMLRKGRLLSKAVWGAVAVHYCCLPTYSCFYLQPLVSRNRLDAALSDCCIAAALYSFASIFWLAYSPCALAVVDILWVAAQILAHAHLCPLLATASCLPTERTYSATAQRCFAAQAMRLGAHSP